jgi:hypothetical protein
MDMEDDNKNRRLEIDLLHAFGSNANTGIQSGVDFLIDDHIKLIYPVGKHCAIKHM